MNHRDPIALCQTNMVQGISHRGRRWEAGKGGATTSLGRPVRRGAAAVARRDVSAQDSTDQMDALPSGAKHEIN
jgi:hypothetical protein